MWRGTGAEFAALRKIPKSSVRQVYPMHGISDLRLARLSAIPGWCWLVLRCEEATGKSLSPLSCTETDKKEPCQRFFLSITHDPLLPPQHDVVLSIFFNKKRYEC
jgi:hypothetical protein